MIQYSYLPKDKENLYYDDFYLLDASHILRSKGSIFIGGSYKYTYKRMTILPYCDIG